MLPFNRIVRFENQSGEILYGEVPDSINTSKSLVGQTVDVIDGETPWDPSFKSTSKQDVIAKVLSPLPRVPAIIGVGLNYGKHAEETGQAKPQYPPIFNKPPPALAGPEEDIPIPKEAQFMDYEGELCIIISKDTKNLTDSDNPLDHILGYTVGNDVSSRWWQFPDRSGQQAGFSKSFDKFAPLGPVLVSPRALPDLEKQTLTTWVNGEQRQKSGLGDLIFDVPQLVRFLSLGRTLERGTVIMTGTPGGVAAFMKPPKWLKDGDLVEVEISGIGRIGNRHVFET